MPTVYLYIPFSENEDPEELRNMALNWKSVYEQKQLIREALTEDTDDPYQAKEIKIVYEGSNGLKDLKEGDRVYILSHGMSDTTEVCNKAKNATVLLKQSTIAERVIADGLPENVKLRVKLYYCDESNNAAERAASFENSLHDTSKGKNYSNIELMYYPGVILSGLAAPAEKEGQLDKAYKRALRKRNLKELDRNELNDQFSALLTDLSAEQLRLYLKSLSSDTLVHLFYNLDTTLIEAIRAKAKIGDQVTFFKSLSKEKRFEPEIYDELGKAKGFRKTFDRSDNTPTKRPPAVLNQRKSALKPSSESALNVQPESKQNVQRSKPVKPGSHE
ncbi:MAG: hypothetical protein AB7I18_01920 [Candidatus Berkiella sp.]